MANSAAAALGRMARGVPKQYSAEELERRRRRLAEARKARWPKSKPKSKPFVMPARGHCTRAERQP